VRSMGLVGGIKTSWEWRLSRLDFFQQTGSAAVIGCCKTDVVSRGLNPAGS